MELVFDLSSTRSLDASQVMSKTFDEEGGVIGRNADCEWTLVDKTKTVSKYHAEISYRDGTFFLTDRSSNGTQCKHSDTYLRKGQAQRIQHGHVYALGDFLIRAQLEHELQALLDQVGMPQPAGSVIPDDAFLELDPLDPVDPSIQGRSLIDEPATRPGLKPAWSQRVDSPPIDYQNLSVPQLVAEPAPELPTAQAQVASAGNDGFWQAFGAVLGIDLLAQPQVEREALALKAAQLLKQSIAGLQQTLWTRAELKNELRLARTVAPETRQNPLKSSHDAVEALGLLLAPAKPGQGSAEQVIRRAFRDLQAHQVALLCASRAAVRSSLEHFSPVQLNLRFERDGYHPWVVTSGSRWRAFSRYHLALQQDDDWCERLLARDFAQAYEEQVRLISSLHNDPQG